MIFEDAIEFFKKTPPFGSLGESLLKEIVRGVSMEFYPKSEAILRQDGPAAVYLSIIKRGEVKVFLKTGEGEEVLIDYLSEGDSFGLPSLISGGASKDNVTAVKDTECYLIGRDAVLGLIDTNASVSRFYLKSFIKKKMEPAYKEMHGRSLLYGGGDKMLFTVTLEDILSRKIESASKDISIKEAAGIMSRNKISSLVLVDSDGFPAGIVTDRDIRNKVAAKGRDVAAPVENIMSVTLIKSEARDYCFEALLKMIRYNVHHLLVIEKGEIRGMITGHDLMLLQGTSPLSVAREIETQTTIDGLVPVSKKINSVITVLVREEAKASNINRIITEINDRLLKKLLEISEKKFGKPPAPYCWIVFGSEGRKEQTFKTDQDNAIIYEDPETGADEAAKYFLSLASYMKDSLSKCGFPPCRANFMASNPVWNRPLKAWKRYFAEWIDTPTPEAILKSLIFFDFRAVHGDFTLAEKLRAHLGHLLKNKKIFLAHMADAILKNRPPLGFWKTFVVEKSGEHKDMINIKMSGLCPIIDASRLSALETGIYDTSTIARLRELQDKRSMIKEFCKELEQAFEFLMTLRLRRQFAQIQKGIEPDNFINPNELSRIERKVLEESLKIISNAQESIKMHYRLWI